MIFNLSLIMIRKTQGYNAHSRKIGKRFVEILYVELDSVHARKWNVERVIVFESAILQCAQGVNNSTQIQKRILFRLDFWNCGAFDKLTKDTYNSTMEYLRKSSWDSKRGAILLNVIERHYEKKFAKLRTICL